MQAQWPPSPYVGLWSRLAGFKRETLEQAVLRGDVVKPTVMRGTLHLVTARDYPMFWTALRDMPTWYDETHSRTRSTPPRARGSSRSRRRSRTRTVSRTSRRSTATPTS